MGGGIAHQHGRCHALVGQALFCGQLAVGHEPFGRQRAHQQVAHQAHHQHAGQDQHGLVVDLGAGQAQSQLVLAHVVHHHRAQHAGRGPGGEQPAVDGAHHLGAKQIRQVGRHGGKAAAVHADDHAQGRHKQHDAASRRAAGHAQVQGTAQHEKHRIGQPPPQPVRQAGPDKAAGDIEQRQQRGKARRHRGHGRQLGFVQLAKSRLHPNQRAAKHLLQHGRGHADHANAGADVHAQHHPQQPELRNAPDPAHMHMALGDHAVVRLCHRRRPAGRLPTGLRHPVAEGPGQHEQQVDQRHHHKGRRHADIGRRRKIGHQVRRQRRADHGATAKAHDRHASGHTASVGEPLDQRRYRRDVAQPQPDAANHARAQHHQPELVQVHPQRRHQHAAAPAQRRHHPRLARPSPLQPAAPQRRTRAQQHKKQGVHPAQGGNLPITARGEQLPPKPDLGAAGNSRLDAERARQGQPKHRKTIGHANAQVNRQRSRRHQPAVETGAGDGVFFVEEAK